MMRLYTHPALIRGGMSRRRRCAGADCAREVLIRAGLFASASARPAGLERIRIEQPRRETLRTCAQLELASFEAPYTRNALGLPHRGP